MSFPIRGWRSILIFCWMNGGPPALCLKLSQRPRCWDRVSQELATTRRLFSPGGRVNRSPSFMIFMLGKSPRCPHKYGLAPPDDEQ